MTALSHLTSAGKKRKVIGRGGDRGGTSGKGHKGQKARSGPQIGSVFEGGQMPLTRRLPKRGFTNGRFKITYDVINVALLNERFEDGAVVNKESLIEKGLLKSAHQLVKILGHGELNKKLIVHADALSKSATQAITQKGGETHILKRTPVTAHKEE